MKATWSQPTRDRLVRELRECADSTALKSVSDALRIAARNVLRIPARRSDPARDEPDDLEGAGAVLWGVAFAILAVGFMAALCVLAEASGAHHG